MNKEKLSKIFAIVVGVVFLFSGAGKMMDVTGFAYLIYAYGLGWAANLAPLIVVAEIATGLLLIFGIQLRWISLFAVLMLLVFTLAYGYGYLLHGIEDCGCFGVISRAKTPFWLVFLRNAFLIYFAVEAYRRATTEPVSIKWKLAVIFVAVITASFMSGFTYSPIAAAPPETEHRLTGKPIDSVSTELNKLLSPDSAYLIFAFSYSCPHCLNSIENLKQYAHLPEIDRIIGITPTDTVNSCLFIEQFNPQVAIIPMSAATMKTLVDGYPTAFYVQNGYIRHVIVGELPCGYFFRKDIVIKENK